MQSDRKMESMQSPLGSHKNVHRTCICCCNGLCSGVFIVGDRFLMIVLERVINSWPKIFFEVCSLDSWSRFRPEGYCALTIPTTPGRMLFHAHNSCMYVLTD